MFHETSRRDLLKSAGALGAAVMLGGLTGCANQHGGPGATAAEIGDKRRRTLRFAHLTDIHVEPELHAPEGMAACLRHVAAQKDRPQLIVTGGDLVMDSFGATHDRTKTQWDIFTKVLHDECGLPVEHTIGNHDVWGWHKKNSGASGNEQEYGKRWFCELMKQERPYHSASHGGWRFLFLDSITPDGEGYIGRLDDEQFDWFKQQLASTPANTPVVIVSHIPIFSACGQTMTDGEEEKKHWETPGGLAHIDARRIRKLFLEHRNVKLCLSGHLHLNERIDYEGVTYICDGAVCGNWWKGKHYETVEGYGIVDLLDDGSFNHRYVPFGWQAQTPAA